MRKAAKHPILKNDCADYDRGVAEHDDCETAEHKNYCLHGIDQN